jgi:arylsulfatase A-like enzyme
MTSAQHTLSIIATAAFGLGAVHGNAAPATPVAKPNVIYIYADDLGYGDTSCYGATRIKTPHIDTMAREGIRFTDAHASSSTCTPSRYSLLTGEYPWRKKGINVLPGDAAMLIQPGRETIATVMQKAGYTTGAVGKWHLGLGDGKGPIDWNKPLNVTPLDVGFDYSFIMAATADRVPCVYIEGRDVVGLDPKDPITISYRKKVGDWPTGKENPELLKKQGLTVGHDGTIINGVSRIGFMTGGKAALWTDEDMAQTYVKKAVDFIEKNKNSEKPFFLYFATNDIHVPRMPNNEFFGKSGMGNRGDVILQFDWCVGELMKALKERGLDEKTMVIFSSDNGPVVDDGYDDGSVQNLGNHKPSGPFRGGKYSIYEGGNRMPFVVRWPNRIKPGVSDALICQVDLLASLAALTGQTYDKATAPDSQNVMAALLDKSSKGRETMVEHVHSGVLALRMGQWKLIVPGKGTRENLEKAQLYDLSKDIAEKENVAKEHADVVEKMFVILEAERAKGDSSRPAR